MDSTPIYTELRNTLVDPEDCNWGPSAPPEFAASLAEGVSATTSRESRSPSTRPRARRHRAAD
ncbi:hypothetical protein EIL87_17355 [Saccharopolyspora rhizosphaerae]|uniref:Uncharacterized protein n=1 Tax=Saccharopolyspora rhizosphaerae TaxID=2492662 RepID=A0A3R8Q919_9PSEU|nr:hypothetical protein EIL87_17355 [Saccharopolyspora rhizosphaerae]